MNYNEELLPSGGGEQPPVYEPPKQGGFAKGVLAGAVGAAVVIAAILFIGGSVLFRLTSQGVVSSSARTKLSYLNGLIHQNFYENVEDDDLREGLYKGLVEGLDDPYSEYYTKKEYEDFQISTTGNYAGLGAQLSQDKETMIVTVARVYEGSPAEEIGLRAGDEIISADGVKAAEEELDAFVQRIRGEEGTKFELVFSHKGKEKRKTVTRASITIPSVSHRMLGDGIGLIEIAEFSSNTLEEYEEALADLEKDGLKGIIFDLRTNPGGMVSSVTDILDDILPEGTTVYMVDKKGEKTTYTSDEEKQIHYPIAVLTSENTASAAEIFAGAIRDYDYGTLIGQKTYGKGVVQSTFPLPDGSALKLTIASYYTPNGESIHKKGIEPDIELEYKYSGDIDAKEYDYGADNQIQKAIEILKDE